MSQVATRLVRVTILALALCLPAATAQAGPLGSIEAGDYFKVQDSKYGTTNGGEFTIVPYGPSSFDAFITFCVQKTQFLNFSHVFYVKAISPYAEHDPASNGGNASGRDYLDPKSAWIYSNYLAGNYAALGMAADWSGNRRADAVQNTLWCLEQESGCTNADVVTVKGKATIANPQTIGNVRVMNVLWGGPTGNEGQDLVVETTPVPEPASMVLFGTGLVGLAATIRRRRKQ